MRTEPFTTTDSRGRKIVLVDIGRGRRAMVLEAEYKRLIAKGVSSSWFMSGNGRGLEYVSSYFGGSRATGGRVNIARLILGLGDRETVVYRSADRLDLRPENIAKARGWAKGKETFSVMRAAA